MKRRDAFFLVAVVAAVILIVDLGGLPCGFADEPASVAESRRLSAKQRAQIDALALSTKDVGRETVIDSYARIAQWGKFYDDFTGWMISRTPLPAAEEFRRATAVHKRILKDTKIGPTPRLAERTLARLVETLPARMRPKSFEFSLAVIEDREHDLFTVGGGYLYITRGELDALLVDEARGQDYLAFELARQLGHICRLHCRAGYRLMWLREQLPGNSVSEVDRARLQKIIRRTLRESGSRLTFKYNREQRDESDLFALHLCRNAGFELENCLDVLRVAIAADLPEWDSKPKLNRDFDLVTRTLLQRLKHCRYELDGISNGDQFGLFEFDRSEGVIKQIADNALDDNVRGIIFVHGMESDLGRFRSMMKHVAAHEAAKQMRILGFQYPHDQSLARSGIFLKREVERVAKSAEGLEFVCHSAGGLVFRHYAEVLGGKFRKAVFLGTPHGGSNLAELRPIIEAKQFVGSLKFGFLTPLEKIVTDGQGQIAFDLRPESLFLRHLNQQPRTMNRSRYHTICGRALSGGTAFLLQTGVIALRAAARQSHSNSDTGDLLRRTAIQWVKQLRVPREATNGDFAVSVESATLEDAASNATFPVNHRSLTSDPAVMKRVVEILLD